MGYKKFLLVILCTFTVINCLGQETGESGDSGDVESRVIPYCFGGANFSSLVGLKDGPPQTRVAGFNAGIGITFMLDGPGKFQLDMRGFYSEQGTKFNNVSSTDVEKLKITYINVPATLHYYPSGGDGFYIGAGPQIGWQVGGGSQYKNGDKGTFKSGFVNGTVWDGVAAIGYTNNDFGIEASYQHGLTKVLNPLPDYRNSVIQVRMFLPLAFLSALTQ